MWEHAANQDVPSLQRNLLEALADTEPQAEYSPSLRNQKQWHRRGAEVWTLDSECDKARRSIRLDVNWMVVCISFTVEQPSATARRGPSTLRTACRRELCLRSFPGWHLLRVGGIPRDGGRGGRTHRD